MDGFQAGHYAYHQRLRPLEGPSEGEGSEHSGEDAREGLAAIIST